MSDRPLPSDKTAEQAVLGAVLVDNSLAGEFLTLVKRSDLFLESHKALHGAFAKLHAEGAPIDLITLPDAMGRAEFERFGGGAGFGSSSWISKLIDHGVRGANIAYYAKRIADKAAKRAIIETCEFVLAPPGAMKKR